MNIIILTNDNFFSFTVLKDFLEQRKADIRLIVFSSALIGKRGTLDSIKWSLNHTGLRHTLFKLTVYGVFKIMRDVCRILPFIRNTYSTRLWASRNKIESVFADDINAQETAEKMVSYTPDLIISVSMNQIAKKKILDMPLKGCINVHCAPLPRYGGMSPYVWALANNEKFSAATIHYMEEGLDEGEIIWQERVAVFNKDSAFSLFYRCCQKAKEKLPEVVKKIEDGTVTSCKQNMQEKTYFSWPTRECVRNLRKNGFVLIRISDILKAICCG